MFDRQEELSNHLDIQADEVFFIINPVSLSSLRTDILLTVRAIQEDLMRSYNELDPEATSIPSDHISLAIILSHSQAQVKGGWEIQNSSGPRNEKKRV